ncbi:hypothetical protein ACHQM5_016730 [Ranunculus cassubicifolius]
MADAALSAFFPIVLQQLASSILEEYRVAKSVDKQLKKLSRIFSRIQAVLSDAEQRQIQEEAVRIWLRDLKDVAYDADDLLDEMATEVLRSNQVRTFFSSFSLSPKINDVIERLSEIAKEREDLHLREGIGGSRYGNGIMGRPQTSSLVDESSIFGRSNDKEKIVSLLLSDDINGEGVSVIPIVGMGGLGKTTLVQLVYNDERVERHFELRMWVCVVEDFDVRNITKAIIESATGSKTDLLDMDLMQRRLQNILNGRRFLLTLDDVWNENGSSWETLQIPFKVGADGSKIIVTTRSKIVSLVMGSDRPYYLEGLSNEHCWSLLKQRAIENRDSHLAANVVTIGKRIVNKCQGLPLAARNFGALLKFVKGAKEWEAILRTETCDLPDDKNDILPNMRMSYHHLPVHLKPCFGFCSLFPRDYIYQRESLVLLWIAEGFVQAKGGIQLEDAGDDYFSELLSRSFFQYSHVDSLDGQPRYKMHGFMHDLAKSVMQEECCRFEAHEACSVPKRARHVSLIFGQAPIKDYGALYKHKSLRTLLFMGGYRYRIKHISSNLFLRLKCMRVLDMSNTSISEVPTSIGNLKHLRYLDLSWTRIEQLPESLTTLVNLQTLNLIKCLELLKLPHNMKNLVNLRHLNISYSTVLLKILPFSDRSLLELPKYLRNLINLRDIDTSFSSELSNILPLVERSSQLHPFSRLISTPPEMGRLINLQTLTNFVVSKMSGCGIEELKSLVNLRGAFRISKLENVVDVLKAKEACLLDKDGIHDLALHWSDINLLGWRNDRLDEKVLESLQPHINLKELRIENYGGVAFPSWNLKIHGMYGLKHVGSEFCGDGVVRGFLSLEMLEIKDMPDLEDLSGVESGEFPCLRELTIWDCPKLKQLQNLPPTLAVCEIANCIGLMALPSLPSVQSLVLGQCDNTILSSLVSIPSLSSLTICHFPKLEFLPDGMFRHLGSLKELKIIGCDNFTSLPKEDGLQKLVSLEHLEICSCVQLNSLHNEILPSTLKSFRVVSCPSLVSLSKDTPNLKILEVLEIWKCPKLQTLPGNKLSESLQVLSIKECPTLKEAFQKGRKAWHTVAHIPNIEMDSEWLQQHW